MSFVFNNDIKGNNAQVNQGQNVTATQTNSPSLPTVDDVFTAIEESIPEESREEIVQSVVEPLRMMAKDSGSQDKQGLLERTQALALRLSPFAPSINKAILAFGEGSLKAIASSNPVVQGVLAAIQAAKS